MSRPSNFLLVSSTEFTFPNNYGRNYWSCS
jgi:hypothetical protein